MDLSWESFLLGLDYRLPTWRKFDHQSLEQVLARGVDAGVRTLRLPLIWAELQPGPGRFSDSGLRDLEAVMNTGAALRVQILPVVFAPADEVQLPPWAFDNPGAVLDEQLRLLEVLVSYFRGHRALMAWELDLAGASTPGLGSRWRTELLPALRQWDSLHPLAVGMSGKDLLKGDRELLEGLASRADFVVTEWSGAFHLTPLVAALVWRLIEKRVCFVMGYLPSSDLVLRERLRVLPRAGALGVFVPCSGNGSEIPGSAWKALTQAASAGLKLGREPGTLVLDAEEYYRDPEASWQTLYRVWEDRW